MASLVALIFLGGCSKPSADTPHIVLVLVDQLRADAVERHMPRVHALAQRGVVFENARSVAPWTYPSVISMFSGLYPQQHGADGHPLAGKRLSTFDANVPLLPKLLQRQGYRTTAFVTNPFLQTWNPFHEGFDHYEVDAFIGSQGNLRGLPEMVWREDMFADSVNAELMRHFDGFDPQSPEFTYVHYIDVHGPWEGAPFPHGADAAANYRAGAEYVDGKIVELYEYFQERYGDAFVFLVTSDHGQEDLEGNDLDLGEGQPWRKKKATVHDFNLRIPLIFLPTALVPEGLSLDVPCANIDVFATLIDWLGSKPPANVPARSLLTALRGGSTAELEGRAIYAKMSAFGRANDCIVQDGRKYLRHLDPRNQETVLRTVFDLREDPRESSIQSRVFEEEPQATLEEAAGDHGTRYPGRFMDVPLETLEDLEALGYLGGADEQD